MGKTQSKSGDSGDGRLRDRKKDKERGEVVEEMFVQKIAYKCGVSEEQLEAKKETYMKVGAGLVGIFSCHLG